MLKMPIKWSHDLRLSFCICRVFGTLIQDYHQFQWLIIIICKNEVWEATSRNTSNLTHSPLTKIGPSQNWIDIDRFRNLNCRKTCGKSKFQWFWMVLVSGHFPFHSAFLKKNQARRPTPGALDGHDQFRRKNGRLCDQGENGDKAGDLEIAYSSRFQTIIPCLELSFRRTLNWSVSNMSRCCWQTVTARISFVAATVPVSLSSPAFLAEGSCNCLIKGKSGKSLGVVHVTFIELY